MNVHFHRTYKSSKQLWNMLLPVNIPQTRTLPFKSICSTRKIPNRIDNHGQKNTETHAASIPITFGLFIHKTHSQTYIYITLDDRMPHSVRPQSRAQVNYMEVPVFVCVFIPPSENSLGSLLRALIRLAHAHTKPQRNKYGGMRFPLPPQTGGRAVGIIKEAKNDCGPQFIRTH